MMGFSLIGLKYIIPILMIRKERIPDQKMKHGDDLLRQANCIGERCACWQPATAGSSRRGRCGLTNDRYL